MADKPRVKAPKQRAATANDSARRRKTMAIVAGVAGLVLGFVVVAAALGMFGGSSSATDVAGLRTTLQDTGCTLQVAPALQGVHSITDPSKTSPKWNTDPPTSGPHYAVAAIFGIYEDEIEMARLVHNLEHGGIYIFYGNKVPSSTVDELRTFYDKHTQATILAPLPRLGNKIALGAWTTNSASQPDNGVARLVKCTNFDDKAFTAFFSAYQGKGPERFPMSSLLPGS